MLQGAVELSKMLIGDLVNLIKNNWKKVSLIIVFDVLFLLLILNMRFISVNAAEWIFKIYPGLSDIMKIGSVLLLVIIGSISLIIVYSFFKYLVLGIIQDIFKQEQLRMNRLFSFTKLNLTIGIPTIFIYIIIFVWGTDYLNRWVTSGVKEVVPLFFFLFVISMLVLMFIVYTHTLFNLAHNTFLREKNLKRTLKQSFMGSFSPKYYRIYWGDIKIIMLSLVVLFIFYVFMKLFVLTTIPAYLKYGGIYKTGLFTILVIGGYFLLLFNRIGFYQKVLNKSILIGKKDEQII